MEMLTDEQIAEAELTDWRKLGQGLTGQDGHKACVCTTLAPAHGPGPPRAMINT